METHEIKCDQLLLLFFNVSADEAPGRNHFQIH